MEKSWSSDLRESVNKKKMKILASKVGENYISKWSANLEMVFSEKINRKWREV